MQGRLGIITVYINTRSDPRRWFSVTRLQCLKRRTLAGGVTVRALRTVGQPLRRWLYRLTSDELSVNTGPMV